MRKPLIVLLLAASSTLTVAQSASTTTANSPADEGALIKLGGQMMLAGKAYEYDRELADDIGPRLTASPNYVKATDWAVAEFTRLGLANVHKEAWEIAATWEPETVEAKIVTPHEQALHLVSEGWSPSTPQGGIRGNVYYLPHLTEQAVKDSAAKIKDSIVLVDRDSFILKDQPLLFGKLFDNLHLIGEEGAKAIVFGLGATNNAPSMIGNTAFKGEMDKTPSANLGEEDTLLLKRLLDRGPVEIEFSFRNRVRKNVKVDNVVAEIPGSDANGEYVVIGGHLDSWQPGTGAEDNGTGAATVVAVAQAVKAAGLVPRRTMRFILFGGEEEGLVGSVNYVRDHAGDMTKCAGIFITDSGSEPPKGWYTFGRDDENKALEPIKPLLDSLGAGGTTDEGEATFQTDEAPFLVKGVPAFVLWTPMDKYMLLHHKPSDTFDKVDERDLNLGAAVVGITAFAIADAPSRLPQLNQTDMEATLKKIKAEEQYKDLVEHNMF